MGSKADFHSVTKVKDVKGTLRLWQEFRQFDNDSIDTKWSNDNNI